MLEMQAIPTEAEVEEWANALEVQSPQSIVEWAVERLSPGLAMTSNFGVEGIVVIDLLRQIAPQTPIIYLDTGFQFPETDRVKEELQARFKLNIVEYRSDLTIEDQGRRHGEQLYRTQPELCCHLRKVEPLARALQGYQGWIAALRRDQSPARALIRVVEWNSRHRLVKVNPLATWTRAQVWEYVLRRNLPYNSLYDDGYTSIGCQPCTWRVEPGAGERSGRWVGANRLECGIHLENDTPGASGVVIDNPGTSVYNANVANDFRGVTPRQN